jgi:uncharacterized membrane protein
MNATFSIDFPTSIAATVIGHAIQSFVPNFPIEFAALIGVAVFAFGKKAWAMVSAAIPADFAMVPA